MIDFETAIEFSPDTLFENGLCNELFAPVDLYVRRRPNELMTLFSIVLFAWIFDNLDMTS